MKHYSKEQAISVVVSCAERYRDELANKNLLFICQDKHRRTTAIEFSFNASNFLHLTGLKIKKIRRNATNPTDAMSAKEFYEKCLAHRLRISDFEFAKDGTTPLKLDILPTLISKNLSATMVGDYNSRTPRLVTEKLTGGTVACMGFVQTGPNHRYVPNTILKGDIREYIGNQARVIAVFRKPKDSKRYEEITYFAKKLDWDAITYPSEYAYLPKPVTENKKNKKDW